VARTGANLPAPRAGRQDRPGESFFLQNGHFVRCPETPQGRGPGQITLGTIAPSRTLISRRSSTLSASDPNYDSATDTYRQIYRGHDNASAVTNSEGLTVYFDPDTNDVLGFSIAQFSAYYESHKTEDGEFEVSLPAKVPANLEEEMDFDAEAIRSGVRIAEFY
jgi:hypothetical protein